MYNEDEITGWKLSEFVSKLGPRHLSTVNRWIKHLEDQRIHYVNRIQSTNQRFYDELDLQVVKFIMEKTENNKYTLQGVFDLLQDNPPFALRPFPEEYAQDQYKRDPDPDESVAELLIKLQEGLEAITDPYKQQFESTVRTLQAVLDESKNNQDETIDEMAIHQQLMSSIKLEALDEWDRQPDSEKWIKTGWFSKAIDQSKRDRFIENYIKANYEKRLREIFPSTKNKNQKRLFLSDNS